MRNFFTITAVAFIGIAIPFISRALTVSPTLIELEIPAGTRAEQAVRVYNETDTEMRIFSEVMRVVPGEGEMPNFVTRDTTREALTEWMTWIAPFNLPPRTTIDVPVRIEVPEDALPGSYAVALLFHARPEETKDVGVIAKTGPVVLVTVPGSVTYEGTVEEFSVLERDGASRLSRPDGLRVRVKNTGTGYFIPIGTVLIRNTFGQVVETFTVNEDGRRVLSGWTRTFDVSVPDTFMFGRYTATLSLAMGDRTMEKMLVYWVLPWREMLALGAGCIGIIALRRATRRRRAIV